MHVRNTRRFDTAAFFSHTVLRFGEGAEAEAPVPVPSSVSVHVVRIQHVCL